MQVIIWNTIWRSIEAGSLWLIALVGVVYTAGTTVGSCWMMARMFRTETGKQKVGAP